MGRLRGAKKDGLKTLKQPDVYIQRGLSVVVCEPSCASALMDDVPDLVDDEKLGRRIAKHVMSIDLFLDEEIQSGRLNGSFTATAEQILIHGHCHQKAFVWNGRHEKNPVEGTGITG